MAHRKPQPEARWLGARGEGSKGQRPGLPGSCCREVRGDKNNDSGLQEEGGPAATFSLLLCKLPVARACPLEKILKAALVSTMLCFSLKTKEADFPCCLVHFTLFIHCSHFPHLYS